MSGNEPAHDDAVGNALAILRCFEDGASELRLGEIAQRTATRADTAAALLGALGKYGFVDHNCERDTYRLGRVLLVLGRRTEEATGLDGAEALLKQLTARAGESSSLAVREGTDAIVLLLAASPQRLRVEHGAGSRLPLHASAMGKALLAFSDGDPEEIAHDLGPLERFTDFTVTNGSDLAAELRITRERGWAVNRQERYDGVVGVAAPVIVAGRGVVAAIGVQGPAVRLRDPDDPALARLVERTARRVAESFASGLPLP